MIKIKVPNFKKITQPLWLHKAGYSMSSGTFKKTDILEQGTIPNDRNLLTKLKIKKGEKILVIAGFYASWASAIKNSGAITDYSDISPTIVNLVKKNYKTKFGKRAKFRKYICSGYEMIPKKSKDYDWTFTYEACGGKQGLPLAYLRSLLNNKGGILTVFLNPKNPKSIGGKLKTYPNIVNTLAKVYNSRSIVKKIKINACRRIDDNFVTHPFLVAWIMTNENARTKAELDIKVLSHLKNKKSFNIDRESKNFNITKREINDSFRRLERISQLFEEEFIKEIIIK